MGGIKLMELNIGELRIHGVLLGEKKGILGLKKEKMLYKLRKDVYGVLLWILGLMILEIKHCLIKSKVIILLCKNKKLDIILLICRLENI